jgi:hypothetical protein
MDFPEGTDRTPPGNPHSFGGFLVQVFKIARLQCFEMQMLYELMQADSLIYDGGTKSKHCTAGNKRHYP